MTTNPLSPRAAAQRVYRLARRAAGRGRRVARRWWSDAAGRVERARLGEVSPWRVSRVHAATSPVLVLGAVGEGAPPRVTMAWAGGTAPARAVRALGTGSEIAIEIAVPDGVDEVVLRDGDGRRIVPVDGYAPRPRGALAGIECARDGTIWHLDAVIGRLRRQVPKSPLPTVRRVHTGLAEIRLEIDRPQPRMRVDVRSRADGATISSFAMPISGALVIRAATLLAALAAPTQEREEHVDLVLRLPDGTQQPWRFTPSDIVARSQVQRFAGVECWAADRACAIWPYSHDGALSLKIVVGPVQG